MVTLCTERKARGVISCRKKIASTLEFLELLHFEESLMQIPRGFYIGPVR